MFAELLLFGTWPFWCLFAALFIVLCSTADNDHILGAFLVTVVGLTILVAFTNLQIIPWIIHNPFTLLFYGIAYLVIGGVWGLLNWRWFFVPGKDRWYEEHRDETLKNAKEYAYRYADSKRGIDGIKEALEKHYNIPPLPKNNKQRFTTWVVWWWASICWTLFHDPVRRFVNWIYRSFSVWMERVSRTRFAKYDELK